jgi:hypothetical protein
MDTGDIVRTKDKMREYMVACVHDVWLHTFGNPDVVLRVNNVTLVKEATEYERMGHIKALASGTSTNHRTACAKQRLAEGATDG